jgi:hypothetical protein
MWLLSDILWYILLVFVELNEKSLCLGFVCFLLGLFDHEPVTRLFPQATSLPCTQLLCANEIFVKIPHYPCILIGGNHEVMLSDPSHVIWLYSAYWLILYLHCWCDISVRLWCHHKSMKVVINDTLWLTYIKFRVCKRELLVRIWTLMCGFFDRLYRHEA